VTPTSTWFRTLNTNLNQKKMKKIILKTLILVVLVSVLTGCKKELIMFDNTMNLVGFSSTEFVVRENENGTAAIYLGAATGAESTTVTLSVDTAGLGKSAAKFTMEQLPMKMKSPIALALALAVAASVPMTTASAQGPMSSIKQSAPSSDVVPVRRGGDLALGIIAGVGTAILLSEAGVETLTREQIDASVKKW